MHQNPGLFIDGDGREATVGAKVEVLSPVTEQPLGSVPQTGTEGTAAAIQVAEKALSQRARVPAFELPFGGIEFSGMGREGRLKGIQDDHDNKLAQMTI
ncbi:MAG: hypothetical protein OEZ19_02485 [Paracoccaceae bacterium]|nr:hypothetical protein [Paracoccaceae bacterium]